MTSGRPAPARPAVPTQPATFRDVFASSDFRSVWYAQLLSKVGDQLAAVALAVMVYRDTGSPFLTAVTYAVTFLPWVVGGPLLAGLADRFPRVGVMQTCDLGRALLLLLMAVPGLPVPVLLGLLFAVVLLDSPFTAARSALLPEILRGDRYVVGSSVVTMTGELAQVAGFVLGGALVTVLGPQEALLLDAATYLLSALLLVRVGVRGSAGGQRREPWTGSTVARVVADVRTGAALLAGDAWLRQLTVLAWLCAFYVVPEALAVTYAAGQDAGALVAGLLLAANPAGTLLGSFWLGRFVSPARRLRLMGPLAVASCAPLLACATTPHWSVAAFVFLLSGVGSAYNLPANAAFVVAVPAERRGQALGLVMSGMAAGQGLALVAAGAAAELVSPGTVLAVAGAAGTVAALVLVPGLRRAAPAG